MSKGKGKPQAKDDGRRGAKVARTTARKDARRAVNEAQAAANRALRAAGELTPWERACERRRLRRAMSPEARELLARKESAGVPYA